MEKSSYKLLNIILIESSFKREAEISYGSKKFSSDIHVNIENQRKDNKLFVFLTLTFEAGVSDKRQIASKIKMLGIFEYSSSTQQTISPDSFGQINGPAIIFPFVREHLANLSLKAGINPILLPPINFVKLAESNKNHSNN